MPPKKTLWFLDASISIPKHMLQTIIYQTKGHHHWEFVKAFLLSFRTCNSKNIILKYYNMHNEYSIKKPNLQM